jgi:YfiH family protein
VSETASSQAPVLLQSTVLGRLGVPHAFSTRLGGVSGGMFASLNFGNPSDLPAEMRDPPAVIRANWQRCLDALACPGRGVVQLHQVHGDVVQPVWRDRTAGHDWWVDGRPSPKADAIVTDDPELMIAVRVADCGSVLLADSEGAVVGAVHAGWRGCAAGVVQRTVAMMRERCRGDLRAAVGPCIGPTAFEVGREVVEALPPVDGAILPHENPDKAYVDLRAILTWQLADCGVEEVQVVGGCTVSEPERYFSHRRDRGATGRLMAMIGPAGLSF